MVRPSRRKVALGILALVGMFAAGEPARAEFVSGFTGHTLLANQPGSDAVLNFAVYRVTDADFRNDAALAGSNLFGAFAAGVGSGGLDLGATHAEPTDPDVAGDGLPTFNHADDPGFAYVPMFPTSQRVKNADIVAHKGEFLAAVWDPTLGNDIPTAIPHPSPEPGALLLAVMTLPGLLLVRRCKRTAA